MPFLPRLIMPCLLAAGLMAQPGDAACQARPGSSAKALETALDRASWQDAMRAYAAAPAQEAIPVLTRLAQGNTVMAQWFLADALARTGRRAEAARWLYTASLGTRMDASVCKIQDGKLVEGRFAAAFDKQFSPMRADDNLRRQGISQAIVWHKARTEQSAKPAWVCQLVAHERRKIPLQPLYPQRQWEGKREAIIRDYQKQAGLDPGRSPDLIPIRPVAGR